MKVVSISEAKNKLSSLLRGLRGGESVLILDRGRPVARLEQIDMKAGSAPRLDQLLRQGALLPGSGIPPHVIWESQPPALKEAVSVVEVLLDERSAGR
ncbi:MAG: type II toxin-antitoxin system prevent-host-death family antitoxin [Actinobacteria bacterium]|nr:type II toxin-antitoxin system prevent-host-death family antitoxin [Actinomycetota bacterium]